MSYFKGYPLINYKFGNEEQTTAVQNISIYVDIIDTIKDNVSFYTTYNILDGDRPDNVAMKLYGYPDLHWTFYLMNDHIRERGWPLTAREVNVKVQTDHPYTTLTTTDDMLSTFAIGQSVEGLTSGATGTIIDKRPDFGQLIVDTDDTFISGEIITSTVGDNLETITISAVSEEYNSVHHYEDSDGTYVDVDPFTGDPALYNTVSYTDFYIRENEALKEIRAIKPGALSRIYKAIKETVKS